MSTTSLKYIALIDCDNFFVSCERLLDPSLNGKAVGVVSGVGGCFVARSNEVKALGIPMGAPLFKYQDVVDRYGVILKSANFNLYKDTSKAVLEIIANHLPFVEAYSIDEAFGHLAANKPCAALREAQALRKAILETTGIPVSIGVAATKTLAKVACHTVKKGGGTEGAYVLDNPDRVQATLSTLPVSEIWGIGRRLTRHLNARQIKTAWDFHQANPHWIRQRFSIITWQTWAELQGIRTHPISENASPKVNFVKTDRTSTDHRPAHKSILRSASFEKNVSSLETLSKAIARHTFSAVRTLRNEGLTTSQVGVFIQTNRFSRTEQYRPSYTIHLAEPTDDYPTLIKAASEGLEKIYRSDFSYKRSGIFIPEVHSKAYLQTDFFADPKPNTERSQVLTETLDKLQQEFGKKSLTYGSMLNKP